MRAKQATVLLCCFLGVWLHYFLRYPCYKFCILHFNSQLLALIPHANSCFTGGGGGGRPPPPRPTPPPPTGGGNNGGR